MYVKINEKKIPIKEANTFFERIKGLKFVLGPLDYGVRFPKKKHSNTNFLFERVDVVLTDKDEKIIHIIENCGTEKRIRRRKGVYNTYFLPVHVASTLSVGKILNLVVEEEDIERKKELEDKKLFKRKKKKNQE